MFSVTALWNLHTQCVYVLSDRTVMGFENIHSTPSVRKQTYMHACNCFKRAPGTDHKIDLIIKRRVHDLQGSHASPRH